MLQYLLALIAIECQVSLAVFSGNLNKLQPWTGLASIITTHRSPAPKVHAVKAQPGSQLRQSNITIDVAWYTEAPALLLFRNLEQAITQKAERTRTLLTAAIASGAKNLEEATLTFSHQQLLPHTILL